MREKDKTVTETQRDGQGDTKRDREILLIVHNNPFTGAAVCDHDHDG